MHTCTHIHTFIHMCSHAHMYPYAQTHMYSHAHTRVLTCTLSYTHVLTCTGSHTCSHTHTHTDTHTSMHTHSPDGGRVLLPEPQREILPGRAWAKAMTPTRDTHGVCTRVTRPPTAGKGDHRAAAPVECRARTCMWSLSSAQPLLLSVSFFPSSQV